MRFKEKDTLTYEEFKNPTNEYRGVPFWSWNCRLSDEKIQKQLAVFEEMGFGGAIAHSRNGLEDEYLGKRFITAEGTWVFAFSLILFSKVPCTLSICSILDRLL